MLRAAGSSAVVVGYSDTSATPGNATANNLSGRCSIPALGNAVTITNNKCLASSRVFMAICTNDATAVPRNVVPSNGAFTITLNAATTNITGINWYVQN